MSGFTRKEKKRFHRKKYIREHIFDFVLSLIINCLFVVGIIYLCGGTRYALGILLAAVYSTVKAVYSLRWYEKDWLNVNFPAENSQE